MLFGAAAPLGLLAPALRAAGARRIVALTHGHEAGWAALPGARSLLRRIGDAVDVVTYLGEYFRVRLARALSPAAAARMVRLAPGVDTDGVPPGRGRGRRPGPARPGRPARGRLRVPAGPAQGAGHADPGLAGGPRRGPAIAVLLLVGGGPYRAAAAAGPPAGRRRIGRVHRPGARTRSCPPTTTPVTCSRCPAGPGAAAWTSRASASSTWRRPPPGCRSSRGDSGGAPDAVLSGETGYVVPGRDVTALAGRLTELLADPAGARAMGEKGLAWVDREWRWDLVARAGCEQILARLSRQARPAPLRRRAPRSPPAKSLVTTLRCAP